MIGSEDVRISVESCGPLWSRCRMRDNKSVLLSMNVQIEMPDDLLRSLESIASSQSKTLQELAIERLRSFVELSLESRPGTAAAILRAMREPPHPTEADVDALDGAIAAGRLQSQSHDPFSK